MFVPRFVFPLVAALAVAIAFALAPKESNAAESATAGDQDVMAKVAALDAEIAAIDQKVAAVQNDILALRRQTTDADRDWQKVAGDLERLETRKRELQRSVEESRKTLDAAAKAQGDPAPVEDAAGQEAKADQQPPKEATDQDKETAKKIEQAEKTIADAGPELKKIDEAIPPLMPLVASARQKSEALHRQIDGLQENENTLSASRFALTEKIERLLRESGQWISFKDQIAPIFHSRCVACHNVRNAQGRYNMANFDALISDGESGQAITPGQADRSLLVQMIEDGSMPYDADPLSDAEIKLVRRWVDLGARIEIDADRGAPLIRLMPRVKHPAPPESYASAIPVTALAISNDGKTLASSGYHEVLLWTLADDGSATLDKRITNVAQRVHGLAFHPTENWLAVASGTPGQLGEVKLFDWQLGDVIADLIVSEDEMFDVAFSPDGKRLASCGADGAIAIFDRQESGTWRSMIIEDHADWVNAIAWSPDAAKLVSASRDKTSKVFDAVTGKLMITFNGHAQNVSDALFTNDGKRIASAGDDFKVRVWTIADAKQDRDIKAARSEIAGLVSYGKNEIIAFSADNVIRIHNVDDGKVLKSVDLPTSWISSLVMSKDKKAAYFGDHAGRIHTATLVDPPAVMRSWDAAPR
jgi:WD40 repeat protein/predicted  nucleic acid-binding Zn-ribbon protein